jgi:hypothetical protein
LSKAVAELAASTNPLQKRSYFLLKVLSVLPYGETLQRLKRFDPTAPIYSAQAEELLNLDLIEVRYSSNLIEKDSTSEERLRLLFAPRPVREYVLSLISQREIDSIVRKAVALYFGEEWKTAASFRRLGSQLATDDGSLLQNPHALVLQLAGKPVTWQVPAVANGVLQICRVYSHALYSNKHYRAAITVCRDVLAAIPEGSHEEDRRAIKITYAKSLRMAGDKHQCEILLDELNGYTFAKAIESDLALTHALCMQGLGKHGDAIESAKLVIKHSQGRSAVLQAKSIILEIEGSDGSERELLKLETEARKGGHSTVANNLALDRFHNVVEPDVAEQLLDEVFTTAMAEGDQYTAARATVQLGLLKDKHGISLSPKELARLISAYQYLYGQRFDSLFHNAHKALWSHFIDIGDTRNLLSLFKHSSFIWRLNGNEGREQKYALTLAGQARPVLNTDLLSADRNTAYFLIRLQQLKDGHPELEAPAKDS